MFIRIGLTALLLAGCITCLAWVSGHDAQDRDGRDGPRPGNLLAQHGATAAVVQ